MRLSRYHAIGALMAGATILAAGVSAQAAMVDPNDAALKEAVKWGETKFDQHPTAFKWDYFVTLGLGYPDVTLRTRYFAVADYVRRSEFQRKFGTQRVHQLNDARIKAATEEVVGGLQFIIGHVGPTDDFLKAYEFSLKVGDKTLKPIDVAAPSIANPSGFMGAIAFAGEAIVDFDAAGLKGDEKLVLVIKAPDGRGPSGSKNAPFEIPFDLSKVK